MKNCKLLFASIIVLLISVLACNPKVKGKTELANVRPLKDTIGFARYSWQMDSLMSRMDRAGWKAAQLGIENFLVFDDYTYWRGPWKDVPVSPIREELFNLLGKKFAIVSDTLQKSEHSVEALVPFLQYFNRNISIVPILVPAMSPARMQECGKALSDAIQAVAEKHKWEWGTDYAI
jgi:Predicted dioxygenase